MADCMTSSPGLAPSVPKSATPQQYIAAWVDLMDACEQFLLAGLRREIGPEGDIKAAYRKWYAEQMEEHDRMILHMMREFDRRWAEFSHGGVNRRCEIRPFRRPRENAARGQSLSADRETLS